MNRHPIIIDTDPGVDDAFAIMMALCEPNIDIRAYTTTCGNVGLKTTTRNMLGLKHLLNLDTAVYAGAEQPLAIPFKDASDVHGDSGLGYYQFSEVSKLSADEYAWDAIYRIAKECNAIDIVALGPLTNIAIALLRYPDLPKYIRRVISMGGTIGYGNTAPYSEFNYWCDPLAAKLVLESELNVVMVGLNATRQTLLSVEDMERLKPKNPKIAEFTQAQNAFYWERLLAKGLKGFHLPDAVAVAYLLDPEVLHVEEKPVKVITDSGIKQGWTVVDLRRHVDTKLKTISVALSADKERYLKLLLRINHLLEEEYVQN